MLSLCRLQVRNKPMGSAWPQILSFPMGVLLLSEAGSYLNIVLPLYSQSKALGLAIQILP